MVASAMTSVKRMKCMHLCAPGASTRTRWHKHPQPHEVSQVCASSIFFKQGKFLDLRLEASTARSGPSFAQRPRAAAAFGGWIWRPVSPVGSYTGPSVKWSRRSSPRPVDTWSRSPCPPTSPRWSTRTCPSSPRSPRSSCWRSGAPSPCSPCRGAAAADGGRGDVWVGEASIRPRWARNASSSTAAAARRCASPARPPSAPSRLTPAWPRKPRTGEDRALSPGDWTGGWTRLSRAVSTS